MLTRFAVSVMVVALVASGVAAQEKPPAGDRVLIILADGFNDGEYRGPSTALREAGYRVDVAGIARGVVAVSPGKPNPAKDVTANLSLDEVDVANYVGLVIPGGYSPGNLEKHPKSLEICRAFLTAGKPVAAICHGPRLLMRCGLMKDRVGTCLAFVADELADEWKHGAYGKYLDRPTVLDRNLLTARYPGDVPAFSAETLKLLASAGGLPVTRPAPPAATQAGGPELAIVLESGFSDRTYIAVMALAMQQKLPTTIVAGKVGWVRGKEGLPAYAAAVAPPEKGEAIGVTATGPSAVKGGTLKPEIADRLKAALVDPAYDLAQTYTAAIALRQGFDDFVYVAALTELTMQGKKVVVIGPAKGELRGLNGVTAQVGATYDDAIKLAPDAVIVAPGGIWPEKRAARQATQPAWIEQQDQADQKRIAFLAERYQNGATVVTFGFDGWRLGRREQFKGKAFAASDQCVWSFDKTGGSYSPDAARLTGERLVSAKGFEAFAEAMGLAGKGK